MIPSIKIDESAWDNKEFDWMGKSFYYVTFPCIFSNPIGLIGKLEQISRDARQSGYKIIGKMVLVEIGSFGGQAMIEVEKLDRYDANVINFDEKTTVLTVVYRGSPGKLSAGFKKLKEMVASRKGMAPRKIMYAYTPVAASSYKTVLFALT